MQSYGAGFAKVYNRRWSRFSNQVAPLIQAFYEVTPFAGDRKTVLDLCCGTGQLAAHFLQQGYRVVGIDLSEPMLELARENTRQYLDSGQAKLINADVADFSLDEKFGLVVSTFDALNHLPDVEALKNCFRGVLEVSEGVFIFDLNTRAGLKRWNSVHIDEGDDDCLIITRGIFDGVSNRAWTKITGFSRTPDGFFERFDETAFNTVFSMATVQELLLAVGWKNVHFAQVRDLATPINDPETEGRVFVVATKT